MFLLHVFVKINYDKVGCWLMPQTVCNLYLCFYFVPCMQCFFFLYLWADFVFVSRLLTQHVNIKNSIILIIITTIIIIIILIIIRVTFTKKARSD